MTSSTTKSESSSKRKSYNCPSQNHVGDYMSTEQFGILDQEEDMYHLKNIARTHLEKVIFPVYKEVMGLPGQKFVKKLLESFQKTGSPIFINLDYNVSEKPLREAESICKDIEMIVRSSAGHVSAYKMNFQSMLTFLIAERPEFVSTIRDIFRESCEDRFGVSAEPAIWLDQKLADIPNTNFQAADILYKLGFDAVHCMPMIGPDSAGAVQLAAEANKMPGVVHVINLTHPGYSFVKREYYQGENGEDTLRKLRENALGTLTFPTRTTGKTTDVTLRAIGTIEPANRPFELYTGYTHIYKKKLLIFSIGIGPQGALPGCALYAGATYEGIGRFMYLHEGNLLRPEKITEKARITKICTLLALNARFSGKKYPLERILEILKEFRPGINEETRKELERVFQAIQNKGLF